MQIGLLDESQLGCKEKEIAGRRSLFTVLKFNLQTLLGHFIDQFL